MPSPVLVNLDGDLVPPSRARVSVLDRGFLYGDSVYEVIRTYGRRPFEIDQHLRRLAHSAERIGLTPRWDALRIEQELGRTLRAAEGLPRPPPDPEAAAWNVGEWSARVVMTRGAGEMGLDPSLAVDPLAVIILQPIGAPPARAYAEGVKAILATIPRPSPEAVDPTAKTGAHLPHVLAMREARTAGAHEALLRDAAGRVTEGCSSSLFAVRDGGLLTPPLTAGILEGVTRGVVLRLARSQGLPSREVVLTPADLETADEIFITSTAREILPVTRLGDRVIGDGRPGPVTARLHRAFRELAGGPVGPPGTT
jgi:branched-chain amino acid aminotransferase